MELCVQLTVGTATIEQEIYIHLPCIVVGTWIRSDIGWGKPVLSKKKKWRKNGHSEPTLHRYGFEYQYVNTAILRKYKIWV